MIDLIPWVIIIVCTFLSYCQIKYTNPYKLELWIGDKGCGKTTNLARLAFKFLAKGWTVYTNEDIPGTYKVDPYDLGVYEFERNSLVLIDEAGIYYDNRKFKTFSDRLRDYVKLQRHYKNRFVVFSQVDDVDVKIKKMCDAVWLLRSHFNCISVGKKLMTYLDILDATGESESKVVKNLKVMPFFLPGARFVVWMPKYHKYFNSYAAPQLLKKDWNITELPAGVKPPRKLRDHFISLGQYTPVSVKIRLQKKMQHIRDMLLKIFRLGRRRSGDQDPDQQHIDAGRE